jgi:hypothetical protein
MAISDTTRAEQPGSGRGLSLNRVQKNIREAGTTHGARASFWQPVIPPAPLTGDVGRGCGDASRALLFFQKYEHGSRCRLSRCANANPARHQARRIIYRHCFYVTAIASRLRHPLSDSCFKRLLARGCANCAGRTAPGWRRRIPSRAGTALRSGTPVRGARRSGTVRDRR